MSQTLYVDEPCNRLDRWLAKVCPNASYSMLQKWIRKGEVRVNKKRAKGDQALQPGDEVRLPPQAAAYQQMKACKELAEAQVPPDFQDWIIFEDDSLLALNKPAGLSVQGGTGQTTSIDDILKSWAKQAGRTRPLLTHRLDKETSGALLCACNARDANVIAKQFQDRQVQKTYWALVSPIPGKKAGRIDTPLEKLSHNQGEQDFELMHGSKTGREAITDYKIIEANQQSNVAWLEVQPQTGRTHQIRAHLAINATPVFGDRKYGKAHEPISQGKSTPLCLHALSLGFMHPVSGHEIIVEAPLPQSAQKIWKNAGFKAPAKQSKMQIACPYTLL